MTKQFFKFIDTLTKRGRKRKSSITVKLSGWHLVAALGVIGVVISFLFSFSFLIQHKTMLGEKKKSVEGKHASRKPTREIGFIFRGTNERQNTPKLS